MTPTTRDRGGAGLPPFRYARPARPGEAFQTAPRYRLGDGALAGRPAAGGPFSAARLAAGFTPQALDRGLFPESPWADSARVRPAPPRPSGRSAPAEFAERFEDALERMIGDREVVAVALAGDLESAALADRAARLCRRTGRTLLAVTVDDADDLGRRSRHLSERLMEHLGLRCRHLAVEAVPGRWPEPEWSEHGPRFEMFPRFRSGMGLVAEGAGAQILLHGTGGERLLGATPYLASRYLRSRALHDLVGYWRDGREAPGFPAGELLAAVWRRTGRGRAGRLFWTWTGLGRDGAPDGGPAPLTPPMAAAARAWSQALQAEALRAVVRAGATWPAAFALHRLFPYDVSPPATGLPEASPFLDPRFAAYAYHLPPEARYSADHPDPALREHRLLADLLPDGIERVVPSYGRHMYRAFDRYWRACPLDGERCVELGLLRPDWRGRCAGAAEAAAALAAEIWVRGAEERGAVAK
ncbi:asparagine synthase-related protein [Spirillospora sp. NPDC049024]